MAELQITFIRNTLSDGFYLGTEVIAATDIVEECLVATVGREGNSEYLARVATLNDFDGIDLATSEEYQWLRDDALYPLHPLVTDTVVFTAVPTLWTERLGYTLGTVHAITAVTAGPAPQDVVLQLSPALPAFGEEVSFSLYRGGFPVYTGTATGTVACHPHTAIWEGEVYYRKKVLHTSIPNLVTAINKFVAIQTEAQSLVDNTERYLDEYAGTDTEVYT